MHALPAAGLPDMDPVRLRLALAQMPARLRGVRRQFQRLTGFAAVTSVMSVVRDRAQAQGEPLSPPVHPRCAERLRSVGDAPCDAEWQHHVANSRTSQRTHIHVCPLGLRCSCVPIYLGGMFIGVAKLVADGGTPASDFSGAAATLTLSVSLSCHESYVSVLQAELQTVRQRARASRPAAARNAAPAGEGDSLPSEAGESGSAVSRVTIVDQALDYLQRHQRDPDLSLRQVAASLGCNGRYLTHLFTQVVGQRMRGYLVGLRVEQVCRELMHTDRPIKRVAFDAGFRDAGQLLRAFQRHVGVAPSAYRHIFGGG